MSIADDNISGSYRLAGEALILLQDRVAAFASDSPAQIYAEVSSACRELTDAQPQMAAVRNRLERVRMAVQKLLTAGADAPSIRQAVDREIEKITRYAEGALEAIAERGARLIEPGAKVLTHSSSTAVKRILMAARRQGKEFEVICLESRPMCEGALLARELAEAGINVALIADAGAALVMPEVALCLVGADAVTEEFVLNRLGTHALCLVAREFGVPVWCAFESDKRISADLLPEEAPKPPQEITDLPHPNLEVRNLYFERTPLALFTGLISEDGASASR